MADEQRFSLSMTYKNIKDNKITVVLFIGVFITMTVYMLYPVLMLAASTTSGKEYNPGFMEPFVNYNSTTETLGRYITFDSNNTEPCYEDHVLNLGENIFAGVCVYQDELVIYIRKYTGHIKSGIRPTIVGINLNVNQWNVLKRSTYIIDGYMNDILMMMS